MFYQGKGCERMRLIDHKQSFSSKGEEHGYLPYDEHADLMTFGFIFTMCIHVTHVFTKCSLNPEIGRREWPCLRLDMKLGRDA